MADLPEYKQHRAIQPGRQVEGFTQAMHAVGAATRPLADMGYAVAQNASLEQARKAGMEAAKNNQKPFPVVLTQSDAEYVKAYRHEQGQMLQYEGNKLLRKHYEDIHSKPFPTADDLKIYEENSRAGIEDLINNADDTNKEALRRALDSQYESYFYSLSNRVEKSNREYLETQNLEQIQQSSENMDNANLNNLPEKAREDHEDLVKGITKKAELEHWPTEKLERALQAADESFVASSYKGQYARLPEGDKPKFIADLIKNPPAHLKPTQLLRVVKSVQGFANEYDSALAGQQAVDYARYTNAINNGSFNMADAIAAENSLSALQFERLIAHQENASAKANGEAELASRMLPVIDNAVAMADFTAKEVNTVFNRQVDNAGMAAGQKLGLLDQAVLANQVAAPITDFRDRLAVGIKSPDAKVAAQAIAAYNNVHANNPIAVSGMDKDSDAIAVMADRLKRGGTDEVTANLQAQQAVMDVNDDKLIERKNKYKAYTGSEGGANNFGDPHNAAKAAINFCDFTTDNIPPGFPEVFKAQMQANFLATGDWETAKELTKRNIRRNYGETEVNGYKEVMYLPPDKFNAFGARGAEFIKKQMIQISQESFAKGKELFDQGLANVYYTFDHNSINAERDRNLYFAGQGGEALVLPGEPLTEEEQAFEPTFEKRIKIEQHSRNPFYEGREDVEKGYWVISSDPKAGMPEAGTTPNYFIEMEIGNNRYMISNPENPNAALRIQPNTQGLNKFLPKAMTDEEARAEIERINREVEEREKRKKMHSLLTHPPLHGIKDIELE